MSLQCECKNLYRTDIMGVDATAGSLRVEIKSGKKRGRYPRKVRVLNGSEVSEFLYGIT